MSASSSTRTVEWWPFRAARCRGVCLRVLQLMRLGWAVSSMRTTCRRPYRAARSSGVSPRLFLMLGSVSSCSKTRTTSEWPYWAAQCRAVSFSRFYIRERERETRRVRQHVTVIDSLRSIHYPNMGCHKTMASVCQSPTALNKSHNAMQLPAGYCQVFFTHKTIRGSKDEHPVSSITRMLVQTD